MCDRDYRPLFDNYRCLRSVPSPGDDPKKALRCGERMLRIPKIPGCLECIKESWTEGDSYTEMFDNKWCQGAYNRLKERNWDKAYYDAVE